MLRLQLSRAPISSVPAPKAKRGGGNESDHEVVGRSYNKEGCDPNGNDGQE
jgi:hypothetical protein